MYGLGLLWLPDAGTERPAGPYPGGSPTVPAVLAGYLHRDPKGRQRVLAAAPFLFGTEVTVGARKLSSNTDRVHVLGQSFDMADGTLRTNLTFEGWRLAITQFVSRSDPTLACMRIAAAPIDAVNPAKELSIAPNIILPTYLVSAQLVSNAISPNSV